MKALKAQAEGKFDKQIVPITVDQTFVNEKKKETKSYVKKMKDLERELKRSFAGLRPVFEAGGSVTAETHHK
jgi:acetyl-CoA acyltransferase